MEVALGILAVCAIVALWFSARAAITVCVLDVAAGRIRVSRGRIAPSILRDLGDIVRRPIVARTTIRIVRSGGRAELRIRGALTAEQTQQVRNVIGSVPLAKLANAG